MRPMRLDLRGFTAFREPAVVDLTDTDFFVLIGPTGSGKSSILDAVCFALYGTVPRWGGRGVANALAPSANEAAVRLIFESAGSRYAVTRVVRRDGKGRATTRAAGLQALPPSFEPSTLDGEDLLDELGEVLAGTPTELDAAIADIVGLPYDQFIKCVVLPQGEFAALLHARPAERQEILVRLLGLAVYDKIRERAYSMATEAGSALAATEPMLAELEANTCEAAWADADAALAAAQQLAAAVDAARPALAAADAEAAHITAGLTTLDGQLAALAQIRTPQGVAQLAHRTQQASAATLDALTAAGAAEEREDELRAQLAAAADPAQLRRLLDAYAERDRLTDEQSAWQQRLQQARNGAERAEQRRDSAAAASAEATAQSAAAQTRLQQAQTADRAAWLRRELHAGQSCPVCQQDVTVVPPQPDEPAMRAANESLSKAEQAAGKAQERLAGDERAWREADRALAATTAPGEQLTARLAEATAAVADAAPQDELRADLSALETLHREAAEATAAVRAARQAHRSAAAAAAKAAEQLKTAWLSFDQTRDQAAALGLPTGPPAADRDDLAASWAGLEDWTAACSAELRLEIEQRSEQLAAARAEVAGLRQQLDELFLQAGLNQPAAGAHERAAAVAVERAGARREQLERAQEQVAALREQRATRQADKQVAEALANHLRANNFEAWLLEEALEALVAGASRILRELSAGQYDLIHDNREFFVVDHHDAGLRRAVRTLSGGETFQASLALALALAQQLGSQPGRQPGSGSLESILLDEGFGTLDTATLDTVAATLENLAASGDRMVGVVTHVQALAERIPVRFEITKDARSARVERTG